MTRDKSKDILMICKNHYDDKYKTTIDALRAYQSEYTGCEEKYITDRDVLEFLLDTVDKCFRPVDWYLLIRDGFIHDIDITTTGLHSKEKINFSYKYLCNSMVARLRLLRIRNGMIDTVLI